MSAPVHAALFLMAAAGAQHMDCTDTSPILVQNIPLFSHETARIVKCHRPDSDPQSCVQLSPDPTGPVMLNITHYNSVAGFFNVEIYKEDQPKGSVQFICSFSPADPHQALCSRTFLFGSLQDPGAAPGYKGVGDLTLTFKGVELRDGGCWAAKVVVMRRVGFDAGTVAALGKSSFNLTDWYTHRHA